MTKRSHRRHRASIQPSPGNQSEPPTPSYPSRWTTPTFERVVTRVYDGVVFLLLRLMSVDATFDEVKGRCYPEESAPSHKVDANQAELLFKVQREDSDHTDTKVRQLLTLGSSLVTIILVFARDEEPKALLATLSALLLAEVVLCIATLGIRPSAMPRLEDSSATGNREQWARDLDTARRRNVGSHAYRVDCYRAATRYFLVALLMTPVLAAFSRPKPAQTTELLRILQRIEKHGILMRPAPGLPPNSPSARDASPTQPQSHAHSTGGRKAASAGPDSTAHQKVPQLKP
jgi:hypothetical protein